MTRDISFLRSTAFPFVRDVFLLYQCTLHKLTGGGYVDLADSDTECDPDGFFPGGYDPRCKKPNVADANGFIRRIAAALPDMAMAVGAPVDPQWAEIAQRLVPLPVSLGDEHTRVFTVCDPRSAESSTTESAGQEPAPPCNGTASGWFGYPAEAVTLNDSAALLATAGRTLLKADLWAQGNSLCSIFTAAARVGMPVEAFLPQFREAVRPCVPDRRRGNPNPAAKTCSLPNRVVFQFGGGLEITGAAEFVNSMLIQSISAHDGSGDSYIVLFPAWNRSQDASFHQLRAKGAHLVSANYSAEALHSGDVPYNGSATAPHSSHGVVSPVVVSSEAGEPCVLENPWPTAPTDAIRVTGDDGAIVPITWSGGDNGQRRWLRFATERGHSYRVRKASPASIWSFAATALKTDEKSMDSSGAAAGSAATAPAALVTAAIIDDNGCVALGSVRNDGTADISAALTAAAASAPPAGAVLCFPPGVYLISPPGGPAQGLASSRAALTIPTHFPLDIHACELWEIPIDGPPG